MIDRAFADITLADVERLKTDGVQEGTTIEYKRELPGHKDEHRREFLSDVSSFANTQGGDLIFGAAEEGGCITEIPGVPEIDLDAEILTLENVMRDGVSPRMRANFRLVQSESTRLLLVRIEKSWNGPHRVIFRGHDKFYGRNSKGKYPLDVFELRGAFLEGANIGDRIAAFRADRIFEIASGNTPVAIERLPTVVIHIVPLGSFSNPGSTSTRCAKSLTIHIFGRHLHFGAPLLSTACYWRVIMMKKGDAQLMRTFAETASSSW